VQKRRDRKKNPPKAQDSAYSSPKISFRHPSLPAPSARTAHFLTCSRTSSWKATSSQWKSKVTIVLLRFVSLRLSIIVGWRPSPTGKTEGKGKGKGGRERLRGLHRVTELGHIQETVDRIQHHEVRRIKCPISYTGQFALARLIQSFPRRRYTEEKRVRKWELTVQDRMANPPMAIDIWMENSRHKASFGWRGGVPRVHVEVEEECPRFEGSFGRLIH
jgi:hypothetical protein